MKLSVLLLIVTMLQVSASSFAQRITLQQKNAELKDVLAKIRKQTGYDFIFSTSTFKDAKKVNIDVRDADLELVLTKIFKDQPLQFKINDNKSVVITKKDKSVLDTIIDYFSAIDVRGKVLDEQGQPLIGATVKVKGSTIGTVTDKDGEFFLKGVPNDAVLVIAYLGYKPLELKAVASMGVIKMEMATSELDVVVVNKGYYTQTHRLNTGSVGRVTAKDIERQPVTSPLMALQGRLAGVDIAPANGVAGSFANIVIRGRNSISNANATPLYVVDGIPVDSRPIQSSNTTVFQGVGSIMENGGFDPLSAINPANIESIEVLKDADATAIYGSRGANGVILITSKRGRQSERTNLDISFYSGAGKTPRFLDLLNTKQYVAIRKEALRNANRPVDAQYAPDLVFWDTTRYTNWQKVLLGGSATIAGLHANISGGSNNTTFRFGAAYHREDMVEPGDFGFDRINGNLNLNHITNNQKFRASVIVNYGVTIHNLFSSPGLVSDAISLSPNAPTLYDSNGNLNWGNGTFNNPLAALRRTDDTQGDNIILNGNLTYQIIPTLAMKLDWGYNSLDNYSLVKDPLSALNPAKITANTTASSNFGTTSRNGWIAEPKIVYDLTHQDHEVNVVVGSSWQGNSAAYQQILAEGYSSDLLSESLKGATKTTYVTDDNVNYRYIAVLGRIGYNFKKKYLLNLTGRRDGSSRFGPGHRWGNFGAVGAGWVFSDEKFIKKLAFLSFGKIRGSYGITGSDQVGDYEYRSRYEFAPNGYQGKVSLSPVALANANYAWEQTTKLELAMEMGFLKDRIHVQIAQYLNRCSNQLLQYQLPDITGFRGVTQNLNATVENTGLEGTLSTINIDHKVFQWRTSLNFTLPRNRLVSYPELQESTDANRYVVGKPLNIVRLFNYVGVNPTTGVYEVEDVDANGIYDYRDRTYIQALGRKYYGGLNNAFIYKAFELSLFFQFAVQTTMPYAFFTPGNTAYNLPSEVLGNYWQREGDISKYGIATTNSSQAYLANESTVGLDDSSFIRLKTASLSYTLPSNVLTKTDIQLARIYLQGQNLATFSKALTLDPEVGRSGLPPLLMITAGVEIKF